MCFPTIPLADSRHPCPAVWGRGLLANTEGLLGHATVWIFHSLASANSRLLSWACRSLPLSLTSIVSCPHRVSAPASRLNGGDKQRSVCTVIDTHSHLLKHNILLPDRVNSYCTTVLRFLFFTSFLFHLCFYCFLEAPRAWTEKKLVHYNATSFSLLEHSIRKHTLDPHTYGRQANNREVCNNYCCFTINVSQQTFFSWGYFNGEKN